MFKSASPLLRWLRARFAPPTDSSDATGDGLPPLQGTDAEALPEPVRLEVGDVFDLHTIQPREVRIAVEAYLREAYAKGFRTVRIIHGKGRGVQRAQVRSILAHTPFVTGWTDAPPEAGGWGATIVWLAHRTRTEKR